MRYCTFVFGLCSAVLVGSSAAAVDATFPQIRDWDSVRISLRQGGCLGTCPSYSIDLSGDGSVLFTGRAFVAVPGAHRAMISQQAVQDIVVLFREANYFALEPHIQAHVTDGPTQVWMLSIDGVGKTVDDGQRIGPLAAIQETLEAQIGIQKWLRGNADTLPSLKAESWDFGADDAEHRALVPGIARYADVTMLRAVLAQGTPVSGAASSFGCKAIMETIDKASEQGRAGLYQDGADQDALDTMAELLDHGAPSQWRPGPGSAANREAGTCNALAEAAARGLAKFVELLLVHGADPNWVDPFGARRAIYGAVRQTVPPPPGTDYARVLRLLIAAGADLDNTTPQGTPLMHVLGSPELARMLIDAGVDVNAATSSGITALMVPMSADVVRVLLAAGANVNARDNEGNTPLIRYQNQRDPEPVRLLIAAGADINAVNQRGITAVVSAPTAEMTQILLDAGADPRIPSGELHPNVQRGCREFELRKNDRGQAKCAVLMAWMAQHAQ